MVEIFINWEAAVRELKNKWKQHNQSQMKEILHRRGLTLLCQILLINKVRENKY